MIEKKARVRSIRYEERIVSRIWKDIKQSPSTRSRYVFQKRKTLERQRSNLNKLFFALVDVIEKKPLQMLFHLQSTEEKYGFGLYQQELNSQK